MVMAGFLVWWTTQEDVEGMVGRVRAGERDLGGGPDAPDYLRSELRSRVGRPGRGRLWVHPSLGLPPDFRMTPGPLEAQTLESGGIVIRASDLACVRDLPGLVTTMGYERVTGPSRYERIGSESGFIPDDHGA